MYKFYSLILYDAFSIYSLNTQYFTSLVNDFPNDYVHLQHPANLMPIMRLQFQIPYLFHCHLFLILGRQCTFTFLGIAENMRLGRALGLQINHELLWL